MLPTTGRGGGSNAPAAARPIVAVAQRVVLVGATGSGKSSMCTTLFGRAFGLGSPPQSLAETLAAAADSSAAEGTRRCIASRLALRATVDRGGPLDERTKSRDDEQSTTTAAGSFKTSTTSILIQAWETFIGAECFLPIQLIELRDTDVDRMQWDKLLGREAFTPDTAAVIVTVDVTMLFPPAPTVPRLDENVMIKTLAAQTLPPPPPVVSSPTSSSIARSTARTTTSAAASEASSGSASHHGIPEDPQKAILLIPDDVLLNAYTPAAMTQDHSIEEYAAAVRLCRRTTEALRRYHPNPESVPVILCLTKTDMIDRLFEERLVAREEAARLGAALLQRKRDAASAGGTTVVLSPGQQRTRRRPPAPRTLDQRRAQEDMTGALRELAARFGTDLKGIFAAAAESEAALLSLASSPSSTMTTAATSTAAMNSPPPKASAARSRSSTFINAARPPPPPPAFEGSAGRLAQRVRVALTSTVTEGGDSVQHVLNSILCASPSVQEKLRHLLDNIRRTCRLHAALLLDPHSLQIVAADSISTTTQPALRLMMAMPTLMHQAELLRQGGGVAPSPTVSNPTTTTSTGTLMDTPYGDAFESDALRGCLAGGSSSASLSSIPSMVGGPSSSAAVASTRAAPAAATAVTARERRATFAIPGGKEEEPITPLLVAKGAASTTSDYSLSSPHELRVLLRLLGSLPNAALSGTQTTPAAANSASTTTCYRGAVTLDNGQVFFVRLLTETLALVGTTSAREYYAAESLLMVNVAHLGAAVGSIIAVSNHAQDGSNNNPPVGRCVVIAP